jgi:cellulose 1,4-beta-cellobiosidase
MKLPTVVLVGGAAVLLIAVALGQRMGDKVMQQATEQQLQSVMPTPLPSAADASPQPYGPDWKRSQALSAAGDPRFPDPRVPPRPLPTPVPTPKPTPTPATAPTPTLNPNIPIWRQRPLPTFAPSEEPEGVPPSPEDGTSPDPSPTP